MLKENAENVAGLIFAEAISEYELKQLQEIYGRQTLHVILLMKKFLKNTIGISTVEKPSPPTWKKFLAFIQTSRKGYFER
mmetsp:Transcript_5565/g.3182  ORF Transcript_5565/g.3182 Transcript_5565/m.3182 type:complete len:80 (-) Transcript_5565:2231-2470(-)